MSAIGKSVRVLLVGKGVGLPTQSPDGSLRVECLPDWPRHIPQSRSMPFQQQLLSLACGR